MGAERKEPEEAYYASLFRFLRGRRLVVRDDPARAVQVGVRCLMAQGFRMRLENMNDTLVREGSPWTAQAMEIGESTTFRRGCLYSIIGDSAIMLLPFVKRPIPLTLAIVTARWLPDGTSELVIHPYRPPVFSKGQIWETSEVSHDLASPRVSKAIQGVIDTYQQDGLLVEASKPRTVVKDTTCPAHIHKVEALTEWRRW
ncbi:MAG: hypothetical protein FWD18_09110 [Micrococcales bacterium]|nr:hypothetical protein [Micrococcales bacterium]